MDKMKEPKSEDYDYGDAYEIALEEFVKYQKLEIKELNELMYSPEMSKALQIKELKNQQLRWHKAATNEEDSLKQQIKKLKDFIEMKLDECHDGNFVLQEFIDEGTEIIKQALK